MSVFQKIFIYSLWARYGPLALFVQQQCQKLKAKLIEMLTSLQTESTHFYLQAYYVPRLFFGLRNRPGTKQTMLMIEFGI